MRLDTGQGLPVTNLFGYYLPSEVTNAVMGENAYGYAYDLIGNRTGAAVSSGGGQPDVTAYAANLINQYTAISNGQSAISIPAYDADGNMTSYVAADAAGGAVTNFLYWDAENRLVLVSNSQFQVSNAYDHRSRRIRKEVLVFNETTSNFEPVTSNSYLWDDWNIIRETISGQGSSTTNYYTWGLDLSGTLQGVPLRQGYGGQAGGVGGLLAVTTCTTDNNQPVTYNTYFPCYDANGNVTGYVDTNGTVRAHYEYSPFGEITAQSGDMADAFTHRFSTKPFDAETGLVVYQLRPYSPPLGRWLSRDPIGEIKTASPNLYCMTFNDSLNGYDKFGLFGAGRRAEKSRGFNFQLFGVELGNMFRKEVPWGHSDFLGYPEFDYVEQDEDLYTSPIPIIGDVGSHFYPKSIAQQKVDLAIKACKQTAFERAMHMGQDWFSHKNYTWDPANGEYGHAKDSLFGNDPDADYNQWVLASEWTSTQLGKWYENCKKCEEKWIPKK